MRNNGVLWYTKSGATIFFPEGQVRCSLCPCLETYSRNQCRLTGEYIVDIRAIGYRCPLEFEEAKNV